VTVRRGLRGPRPAPDHLDSAGFNIDYDVDPVRQAIVDSWPDPLYMLENLRRKLGRPAG